MGLARLFTRDIWDSDVFLCTISHIIIECNDFCTNRYINMTGKRGRPRLFDEETALRAAGEVFWNRGFAATSLDDLASAMDMNRPSIYKAFGDKESIYRKALGQFGEHMRREFAATLEKESDIRKGLRKLYRKALDTYTAGDAPLGCMVMCTAPAAAIDHPEIQADLQSVIEEIDFRVKRRLSSARDDGQLDSSVDIEALSNMLQALQHSLAIRVRSGESKRALRKFIDTSLDLLLGQQ